MVILFILAGAVFGAIAASFALWSGGSILLALLCYSVFGTIGALGFVYAMYLFGEANENASDWGENSKSNDPVSA